MQTSAEDHAKNVGPGLEKLPSQAGSRTLSQSTLKLELGRKP